MLSITDLLKSRYSLSVAEKELVLFVLIRLARWLISKQRAYIQLEEYFSHQDELTYEWDMERYNFYNWQW